MQASLNQKNSCKGGTKLSELFFAANLEAHPIKKAKIWSGNGMEGTRNVQGSYVAKSKTQQMCRSQGINGQLVGLEQSHGSSLEPFGQALSLLASVALSNIMLFGSPAQRSHAFEKASTRPSVVLWR